MANPTVERYAEVLKKLRTRDGLTVERLGETRLEIDALLGAPAVVDRARATGEPARDALVAAAKALVASLAVTERLILDVALRLGLTVAADDAAFAQLYAPDLTARRRALLAHWSRLHRLAGVEAPRAPSDTVLRTDAEDAAFQRLAALLVVGDASPARASRATNGSHQGAVGRAFVFGGAVTDHLYRIADPLDPTRQGSVQATSYVAQPGGKGLTLAVALSRLGFEVKLVAAIGDDLASGEIRRLLVREGVDTSYLKPTPGAATPHVNVITDDRSGRSLAVAWMNPNEVGYQPGEIKTVFDNAVEPADLVFFTFEIPFDGMRDALRDQPIDRPDRPMVFVTPSPPPSHNIMEFAVFSRVDVVVAHGWELQALVKNDQLTPDDQALYLRTRAGVGNVVVCDDLAVRTHHADGTTSTDSRSTGVGYRESAGAREAFTAALAYQLRTAVVNGEPEILSSSAVEFGAAAMAVSAMQPGVVTGLPSHDEIAAYLSRTRKEAEPT